MRKLFFFCLCLLYAVGLIGQNPNPQQNFNAQVQLASA